MSESLSVRAFGRLGDDQVNDGLEVVGAGESLALARRAVAARKCVAGEEVAGEFYFNLSKLSTDISSSIASQ
jgi:hypothetical protein